MEPQTQSELSAVGNLILDRKKNVVAEVSMELEPEQISAYTHLFSAAPELLHFLENEVRSALEENEKMKPNPPLTRYSHPLVCPDLPIWVDRTVQAMAVVYGESLPQNDPRSGDLCLSPENSRALEDEDGNVVVRVSSELDDDRAREYVYLFLSSGELLNIVESMTTTAFKRHEVGQEVETRYKYMIPDRLKLMSDLIAKAKGATPLSRSARK